ncbi:MAG: peptidoglycan DD-metalloendopeptidase family protein [bacterium]|nr:peptidoglycan DD-metalloendopeptidase family protein [bacterium]
MTSRNSKNYNKYNKKPSLCQWLLVLGFIALWLYGSAASNVYAAEDLNTKILDLREQIEQLTKEADKYRNAVAKTQKEADTLSRQINLLNSQISRLQVQLKITERTIDTTGLEILELNELIFDTQETIDFDKEAISEMIKKMYERERQSLVAILLANTRLSDFFSEAQQSSNLSQQLTGLLSDLKDRKFALDEQRNNLEGKKNELEGLYKSQVSQNISLSSAKTNKDSLLTKTKGEEARYQQLLTEVEKKKEAFFSELKSLETKALESGAFIVHVTATNIAPKGTKLFRWPEDDYRLTQGYGMTTYARRGAYGGAPHNGIDLAGGFGSAIRSIGEGTILASGFNNGFGNWVAVRHTNNMVSVYAHMNAPSGLANTTQVKSGDIIGYEGATGNATGSHLHLSLYRDFFTYINEKNGQLYFNYFDGSLNPSDYLN